MFIVVGMLGIDVVDPGIAGGRVGLGASVDAGGAKLKVSFDSVIKIIADSIFSRLL